MDILVDGLLEIAERGDSARFEVKFVIPKHQILRLRGWVLSSPLNFSRSFPNRQINSLYLDSWDFRSFNDNTQGISRRAKIRLRHYGTNDPDIVFLEAKLRQSQTGYKLKYPITDSNLTRRFMQQNPGQARGPNGWIKGLAATSNIAKPLEHGLPLLFPTVEVSYQREYFVSMDGDMRLTIDTGVRYRRAGSETGKFWKDELAVCELKTNAASSRNALFSAPSLPFRMTRNSKYCRAVATVCEALVPREHWDSYV
ncbi:MAG: polyphosphate polymerase domain-containing protein [Pirellulaceae bacterium]|jgi:hypothetical protein|nr:polyphosphate polymerase domain-containing protein [Pirellulaceae bacterium]